MEWLDIFKSTRIQALVAGILFSSFGKKLGLTEEQVMMIVATICTFIVGRSIRPPAE